MISPCPKCGSERIAAAPDEAPPWATAWTKCFACGKRWNLGGQVPTVKEDDEEEMASEPVKTTRTGDDIVKLVMDLSRKQPAPQTKETTMGKWSPEARARHKQTMDAIHAKKRAGGGTASPTATGVVKPKRPYTFRNRKPAGDSPASAPQLPVTRATSPIVLADPQIINPSTIGNGHSVALPAIDNLIATFEANLATLRGAKELLERHG